ncbi:hypothetical protein [Thioalkalivibrio thiocyanodenitrificans]|uniref:hypothetical protein n=1 Tax=Thioalkalivibrio thiocyanodenitrificans TaxID=243063 RepID=UPI000366F3A0|nr:hypothetical protein [Thioalkalivibrio thiocyanodenitrificans]
MSAGPALDEALAKWRADGRHLPAEFRDFHDQKALFKAIHELVAVTNHEYVKDISWVEGHCYVIDIFLWFMARHGYVLQKSRARLPFEDLEQRIQACEKRRQASVLSLMGDAADG